METFDTNLVPNLKYLMKLIQNCSTLDLEINVKNMRLFLTQNLHNIVTNEMIEEYSLQLAAKMSWQENGIHWYCEISQQLHVYHLCPSVRPKTDKDNEEQKHTSLDDLMKVSNAFKKGQFQFKIKGNLKQFDKMLVRIDIHCQVTSLHRNAIYPVIPSSQEEQEHEKQKPNFAIMEVGLFVGIIVAISFVLCFVRWLCKVFNKPRCIKHSNKVEDKDKNRRKIVKKKIGKDTIKVTIIHEKIQAFYRISGKQGEYRPGFLNLFKSEVKYRIMEE
ncbi:unnamed protein product [Mytilus edulis]|uniref:Uncharacterized protein n=1 Tax=Mytilus edulis TaxID=6550 RepID=A0A8S3UVG8_MYTED|nr:unnamed protein product [Mytilus edulis]